MIWSHFTDWWPVKKITTITTKFPNKNVLNFLISYMMKYIGMDICGLNRPLEDMYERRTPLTLESITMLNTVACFFQMMHYNDNKLMIISNLVETT